MNELLSTSVITNISLLLFIAAGTLWMYRHEQADVKILRKLKYLDEIVLSDLLKRVISLSQKMDNLKAKISKIEEKESDELQK